MRLIVTAMIAAALSLPAQAIEWPWQKDREVRYGYCKGFVVAGLAEGPVPELSRTNLWLAWNVINRAELPAGSYLSFLSLSLSVLSLSLSYFIYFLLSFLACLEIFFSIAIVNSNFCQQVKVA